jgi:hypothetical protein
MFINIDKLKAARGDFLSSNKFEPPFINALIGMCYILEAAKKDAEIERIKLISTVKEENKMQIIRIKDELLLKTFQAICRK